MSNSLNNYNTCTDQIYIGDDKQVNLLLRNHNFAAGVNTPVNISYKIIINPTAEQRYQGDFWGNEGYTIFSTIEYLSRLVSEITRTGEFKWNNPHYDARIEDNRYIPEYITGKTNRGAYQLYEGNYLDSDSERGYQLEVRLENIKRKLRDYGEDQSRVGFNLEDEYIHSNMKDALAQFKWLESVQSVFDLKRPYTDYPSYGLDLVNKQSNIEIPLEQMDKLNAMINHVLHSANRVANIKFTPVLGNATLEFKLQVETGQNKDHNRHKDGDFRYDNAGIREGGAEWLHYAKGKTIHAEYIGLYSTSDHSLSELTWVDIFHELSHLFIDHPNDSVFAPERHLNDDQMYTKSIPNEYRADNGCMSVMAFNRCIYQEKPLQPISYLPIDILALQHMYGANKATEAGDTKYIFSDNQVYINDTSNPMFQMDLPVSSIYSLYDAGGVNTLDLTAVTKTIIIDLEEGAGHFNKIGNGVFIIDYNTKIHNVIIGSTNTSIRLHPNEINKIFIASKGAHVTLSNIGPNDSVILSSNANKNIIAIDGYGCINPYSESGDLETEICIPAGSYIGAIVDSSDFS